MVNKKSSGFKDTKFKMSPADRAKQFMPFDALRGLREALAEKERVIVPKRDLSEGEKMRINEKLHEIRKLDMVTIEYFQEGEYVQVTGVVTKIDMDRRMLRIVNTDIWFDDIAEIGLERSVL